MTSYASHTLKSYLDNLSAKQPVPGGGSAAALVGALGAGLLSMVARYSLGKGSPKSVEKRLKATLRQTEQLRKRFLKLADLDAQAYLGVVKSRKASLSIRRKALARARTVPLEISRRCYQAVELAPFLVEKGNKYLLSDVKVGVEFLMAAFRSAMINVEINK